MNRSFLIFLSIGLVVTPSFVTAAPVQKLASSYNLEQTNYLGADYVYPQVATHSTPSTHRTEHEISAWGDLLLFFGLLSQHSTLQNRIFSDNLSEQFLILAPTNEAFLSFFNEFGHFFKFDLRNLDIISFIAGISPHFTHMFNDLIATHIVPGNWSEFDIVKAGKLESISGVVLNTALFPKISVQSSNRSSQRIFRQILSGNGPVRRLCFIDNVLIGPALEENFAIQSKNYLTTEFSPEPDSTPQYSPEPDSTPKNSPEPQGLLGGVHFGDIGWDKSRLNGGSTKTSNVNTMNAHFQDECRLSKLDKRQSNYSLSWLQASYLGKMTSTMFMGRQLFRSVQNLIMSRTDCIIFSTLVQHVPGVMDIIQNEPQPLHALVPTDKALMEFYLSMINNAGLDLKVPDLEEVIQFLKNDTHTVPSVLFAMPNFSSLTDLILFHFCVAAEKPINKLRGRMLKTVAGGFVRVSRDGGSVFGADYSRGAVAAISSHATLDGFVTPISGVVTKFDTGLAFLMGMLSWTVSQKKRNKLNKEHDLQADPDEKLDIIMQTPGPSESAACFPGDTRLTGVGGKSIRMVDLEAGNSVLVSATGQASKIFAFTHRDRFGLHPFLEISFENGMSLTLSDNHYTYTDERLISATDVQVGQNMISGTGESLTVRSVRRVWKTGRYAPHSMHGDLIVNGVVVSAYTTVVPPFLAHALLAPVRLFSFVTGVQEPLGSVFYNGAGHISEWVPR